MDSEVIYSLLTSYNNLNEPKPRWNEPQAVYGLCIAFTVAATLCVALRLWVRVKQNCIGFDDYTLVVTRLAASACTVAVVHSVSHGLGQHFSQLSPETMIAFQKDFYAALLTYIVSTTLVKMCFLTQYFRIFPAGTKTRMTCWICLAVCSVWGLAFFIIGAAPCVPIQAFFDWTVPGHCYGYGSRNYDELFATFTIHSSLNSALDLVVLAVPLPMYLQKQTTSWKQRASIVSLFGFGLLVFGISIWRLQSIVEHQAGTWPVMDPTWYACAAIVLAVVEVDMASMCASIPVFWPVITETWGKIFVTQEVEVVHENRLSGDTAHGDIDRGSEHSRSGSDFSIKLLDLPRNLQNSPNAQVDEVSYKQKGMSKGLPTAGWDPEAVSDFQVTSQGQRGLVKEQKKYERSTSRTESRTGMRKMSNDLDKETAINLGGRTDMSRTFFEDADPDSPPAPLLSSQRSWPHLLQKDTRDHPTPRWLV